MVHQRALLRAKNGDLLYPIAMEFSKFRHQSDSRYCFSIDLTHMRVRLAVAKTCPLTEVSVLYLDPLAHERSPHVAALSLRYTDRGFHYYEGVMEAKLTRFNYVFRLKQGDEVAYLCETCLTSEYGLAFADCFSVYGENTCDFVLEKPSWQGRVFYQIFPERFASREDPKTKGYVNMPWGSVKLKTRHDAMLGGDLWGVLDQLDYLRDLGIDAIYLTPIHPSESNHKYDVLDYFDVDEHFGGKEAFKQLVEAAHERGMKIVMDLVFNHMSHEHPIFLDVRKNGRKSRYFGWFFIEGDYPRPRPLNYRCFGYHPYMPKVNTGNVEAQDYFIAVGEYWLKNFHVDGFRLDVADAVSHDFWMRFKMALKQVNPDVILFAEAWRDCESFLGPNQFDGAMNYGFLGAMSRYALHVIDAKTTAETLTSLLMRYKDGHSRMMLNILSSHDVPRVKTLCKGDADLALLCYAAMMIYPGFPMVYYGEEIFMEGGHDPDNRRGMKWGSEEFSSRRHEIFKRLIHLHHEPAIAKGEVALFAKDGLLAIRRAFAGISYTFYANLCAEGVPFEGKIALGNRYAGGEIWPKGFVIVEE